MSVDGIDSKAPHVRLGWIVLTASTDQRGALILLASLYYHRGQVMKRFIRSSKYLKEEDSSILFDDTLLIDIDIYVSQDVLASSDISVASVDCRFPGIDQFKDDVLRILEDDYGFDVIRDIYSGKLQKGYVSNREDSVSIYFDTYFDLSRSKPAIDRLGIHNIDIPESGKVFCFIHLRFSDHDLNDEGDVLHRKFLNDNAKKYSNDKVTHIVKEESIQLPTKMLQRYYDRALEQLRSELDVRILSWLKRLTILEKCNYLRD